MFFRIAFSAPRKGIFMILVLRLMSRPKVLTNLCVLGEAVFYLLCTNLKFWCCIWGMLSHWPNLPFYFPFYMKSLQACRKNWGLNISEMRRLYISTIFRCVKLVFCNHVCTEGYIFILLLLLSENAVWFMVLITKCWTDSLAYICSTWDSQVVPVQVVWLGLGQLSLWDLSAFSLVWL